MGPKRPTSGERVTFLCQFEDLPDGRSKGVLPNDRGRDQVVLVRQGSRVFGYINNCPHYDKAPLGWKKDEFLTADRQHIMCASHGALFRVTDGACELGPCLGQSLAPVHIEVKEGSVFMISPLSQ